MATLDCARRVLAVATALVLVLMGCRKNNGQLPTRGSEAGVREAISTQENPVVLHTDDGWAIVGDYFAGQPGHTDATAALLVHQLASDRRGWRQLVQKLHAIKPAIATLAIDLRGHGESTQGPNGRTPWQSFGNDTARWAGLENDIAAGVNFLRTQQSSSSSSSSSSSRISRVVIVGASMGATAGLRFARRESQVTGLVLLSPGTNDRGLDTLTAMEQYAQSGREALLVAGEGDANSAEAVRLLTERARTSTNPWIFSEIYPQTSAHGVTMGTSSEKPEVWDRVTQWIRDHGHRADLREPARNDEQTSPMTPSTQQAYRPEQTVLLDTETADR